MTVKTDFLKEELIEVLSNYDLGKLMDYKPISKGTVQTNFILQTTKDKFIFRYYENRVKGSVEFESSLIKYLKDKNYPCPAPIQNKIGEYVGEYQNKPYIIFEYVEGEHLENPSENQKKQLIEKVAELQNITKSYEPPFKEFRWNYSIELCKDLSQREAKRINTDNARKKLKWYERELQSINLPNTLPKGICHCDFHFSNILFKNGEFKALIDFDDANYTYLTYDLATLINPFISTYDWNTWMEFERYDNVFDFSEARKIVSEYSKYRVLSAEEKEHLFDVFKLSIMLDCLWYFERGGVNDFYERRKLGYLNKLGKVNFYKEIFGEK